MTNEEHRNHSHLDLVDKDYDISDYYGTAELEGEDAKKFLEYDSSEVTKEEEESLKEAEETYKKYCKSS